MAFVLGLKESMGFLGSRSVQVLGLRTPIWKRDPILVMSFDK